MSTHGFRDSQRRSRSPRDQYNSRGPNNRQRSRSPQSHHHPSSSHKHKRPKQSYPVVLPLNASPLSKNDFETYKPMFGLYLDIQKQLVLEELPADAVRGRWKSFVGKWNRGELAEGWYDPTTLQKAQASAASTSDTDGAKGMQRPSPEYNRDDESSGDDGPGPALLNRDKANYKGNKRSGPAIPNQQDLELQRELEAENSLDRRKQLRQCRLLDRKQQKEQLDEIAPRAEAGSKDRMLEKKREKADNNRMFASAKTEAGGVADVPDADLLGDEDGGVEGFKKKKQEMERKKNDREIRREEILRARQEEREERIRVYKAKEDKTMAGLVALAKAKFG